ncbi:hypothetical protein RQM47_03165 [Rubrivirga sp. S365]|uniref:Uncharacterized protein n=1 Tax=Rubrivirga litoralis TaxID=3075598 RepID=A0ABU3BLF2_9BACT|nr:MULTISPECIES: hypothetical protein [unclassified Rubrivirga]MDT0630122.1 hypothetical protein [Rubrivirga sp. F394]MDT7855632.1 hypothetical protein [Rubrivirga sp. S365]
MTAPPRPSLGVGGAVASGMRTLAALLIVLAAAPATAQPRPGRGGVDEPTFPERERIALANVGLTSLFTVARGVVEGRVRSVGDAAEAAAWGAVAGAGFYAAKDQVGRGRGALGLGLAFASASRAENAATGGGPLGHVRVGFGPLDVRLRTPLATRPGPAVGVEVDPLAAVALVAVPLSGGRPVVRGGVLMYVHPALNPEEIGVQYASGRAVGRVVLVQEEPDDDTIRHEAIHFLQMVQASAVTPRGTLGSVWQGGRRTTRGGAVQWDVRTDWLAAALGGLDKLLADGSKDGWAEAEAYELQNPPTPPYDGGFFPMPCPPDLPPGTFCPF